MAGEDDVVAQPGAARDSHAGHDETTLPDLDVMPDLHEVVHLCAPTHDCILDTAAVDTRIGADFNVVLQDTPAHVRDPDVTLRVGEIAEPVPADHCARLQHDPAPDSAPAIADRSRPDGGIVAYHHSVAQRHALRQSASGTQAHVPAQHHERPYRHVGPEDGTGSNASRRVDPHLGRLGRIERLQHPHEGPVRVRHHDAGSRTRRRRCQGLRYQHRPGAGIVEVRGVAAGNSKGEGVRSGATQGPHRREADLPIAKQAATDQVGDRLRGKAAGCHATSCPL